MNSNHRFSYALSTGEQDRERLMILNELHNAKSLELLEITPGSKVLTIGCGIGLLELDIARKVGPLGLVLATDCQEDQLKIAEQNRKEADLQNLEFLQIDVMDIAQIKGQFDRIHCRFVLTHIPWEKVVQVLPILYEKLALKGWLVLEEVSSIESLSCEPSDRAYDKWKEMVRKQFISQKSDPEAGKRIFQHLQKEGYTVSYSTYQPILVTEREKKILALGVTSGSKRLLEEHLVTPEEIEEVLDLLQHLEKNRAIFPRYCEVLTLHAKKRQDA